MEEWVKKLQENAEINTQNQSVSLKNLKNQIEQLTKEFHTKTASEVNNLSVDQCKAVYTDKEAPLNNKINKSHEVSFVQEEYLGASINVIPKSMFEHLKLARFKKTDMLVEMADMTKRAPIGIVENVFVKIDKFLFLSDFIDVFNKEISLGIGDDMVTFDMDKKIYNFTTRVGKIYMINLIYNNESPSRSNAPSNKSSRFKKSDNLHNENNYIQEQSSKNTRILKSDTNLLSTGQSFICVTKELMDALPLGRENGLRFREMICKEVDSGRKVHRTPKNPLENITNPQVKLATKETTTKNIEEQLSINIPFFKALEQMPKYAKFMKDLLARKGKTEETSKITLNERCSAVILNKILFKGKDHGSFTDLEARISLTPYSMYARLDLDGNETITFDIEKSMKFSTPKDDNCLSIDMVDEAVLDHVQEILPSSPLDSFLFEPIINYQQGSNTNLWEEEDNGLDDLNKLGSSFDHNNWEPNEFIRPMLFAANTSEAKIQLPKLKELPSHLEYAFLNKNQEFPVIISSLLNPQEKESLLKVLTKYKAALAWKVSDIKGIIPSFCTHKILMEDNFKAVEEINLVLNWEKCHFMVKEGIILGYKISKSGIEVDREKIDVIARLPYPTKDAIFVFSNECMQAFNILKIKLTSAPVIVAPNWNVDFKLMCDASDYVIGAVLGQRIDKRFCPIYYASKMMKDAQEHYATTEKELLAVVYAFDKL
ncbi:reverse transcriptase domain-containing protein [Tanacetum coccineum]